MTRTATRPNALMLQAMLFFAGLAACLALAAPAWGQDGYSYLRTVEGRAALESADEGTLEAIENQPLIPGDALVAGTGSRVEAILADGVLLRFGGPGELRFDAMALTADTADGGNRLYLLEGEMQLLLPAESESPLTVTTGNATLYLEAPGEYSVVASGHDRTSLVVREGFAETQTDRGSAILRSGEAGHVNGADWTTLEVAPAPRRTRLESWGDELDAEARLAEMPYIEPGMRYRAARMARHGTWVEIDDRWGWQPHVSDGWRPYVHGAWRYTPSGLTWVSSEPWGWVPSHYGSWDLVPGYGWTWFAGSHYSPAAVYWYWGPTHVAWVPAGYYTSFYAPGYRVAPRFGIYGWAGGDWDYFAEWTFCPTRYFGRGQYDRYFRSGYDVGRHATYREIPRGVIATDTRSLRRDVWGDPDRIATRLIAADSRLSAGSLPDVTEFVARRKDVRPEIAEIVRPQEIATLSSRGRTSSPEARERGSIVNHQAGAPLGRPTIERRAASEDRFDDRGSRAVTRPRSIEAPESRAIVELGARSPRTVERPELERSSVVRRGIPTSGRPEDSRSYLGSAGSGSPAGSSDGDDRAVVRRVIEQMRSRQESVTSSPATLALPAAPIAAPPQSSRGDRTPPSATRQGSSSRAPSATSTGSSSRGSSSSGSSNGVRSSSGDSRSSAARSSGGKPPQSQSTSRSASRKPPQN